MTAGSGQGFRPRDVATKRVLARQMVERTLDAGVALAWITDDCIYGDDRRLRQWLKGRSQAYVLAVSGKAMVWVQQQQRRIPTILDDLPATGWERLRAGPGSKGPRWYDWQRLDLTPPRQPGWQRWLLVRRSLTDPHDLTAYIGCAPATTHLTELVRVAGMRWTVEESIQTAKGEVGLDHYEVRSWTGWYRHMTLAMWTHAFLAVVRAETGTAVVPKKGRPVRVERNSFATFKTARRLRSG